MAEYTREQIITQMYKANRAGNKEAVDTLRAVLQSQGMSAAKSPQGEIDFDSGGGYAQRYAVDTAGSDPAAQLEALRLTRPDAMPYGDGNFIYHNPETFQPKILNSENWYPDAYEMSRIGKFGTQVASGIGGFLAASPSVVGAPAAAAVAATGSGILYDKGLEMAFDADDSRGMGEQAKDAVVETALNLVPFEKAGKAVTFAGRQIAKIPMVTPALRAIRSSMQNANKEIAELATKYGVNPTTGVLGNKFLQMSEAVTQKTLGAESAFRESWEGFAEGFSNMLNTFHRRLGGQADPTSAGNQMLTKAQAYVDSFKTLSAQYYDDVAKLIDVNAPIGSPRLKSFLVEYEAKYSQDALKELMQNPKLLRLAKKLDQPLSWKEIKELRTDIGKLIDDNATLEGVANADMKKLYGALTDDLFEGSKSFGDEAFEAATKANDHYYAGAQVIENIIDPIFKQGGKYKTGADVFATIRRQASDPEKLGALRDVDNLFDQADFDTVGSAMMNQLGLSTRASQNAAGTRVSPERVLAQTANEVLPEASQEILFNGSAREIMRDMRVFAEAVQGVSSEVNRSNTAMVMQATAAGSGLVDVAITGNPMGAVQAVGTFLVPYLSSKGLQSQAMKTWLGGAPKEASEKEVKAWMQSGKRIFASEGLQNVWDAFTNGMEDDTPRGALEE